MFSQEKVPQDTNSLMLALKTKLFDLLNIARVRGWGIGIGGWGEGEIKFS
jgi:hypothetical protein